MTAYSPLPNSHNATVNTVEQIPFNAPICLQAHTGNSLQNQGMAVCPSQNSPSLEQLELLRTKDNKVIIQSRSNNRTLQVQPQGRCMFKDPKDGLWEKFEVEFDEYGNAFFISCFTGNSLQCDTEGKVRCRSKNRMCWERWRIVKVEESGVNGVSLTKLQNDKYPKGSVIKIQVGDGPVRRIDVNSVTTSNGDLSYRMLAHLAIRSCQGFKDTDKTSSTDWLMKQNPFLSNKWDVEISYVDDEGDLVCFSTDEEFDAAVRHGLHSTRTQSSVVLRCKATVNARISKVTETTQPSKSNLLNFSVDNVDCDDRTEDCSEESIDIQLLPDSNSIDAICQDVAMNGNQHSQLGHLINNQGSTEDEEKCKLIETSPRMPVDATSQTLYITCGPCPLSPIVLNCKAEVVNQELKKTESLSPVTNPSSSETAVNVTCCTGTTIGASQSNGSVILPPAEDLAEMKTIDEKIDPITVQSSSLESSLPKSTSDPQSLNEVTVESSLCCCFKSAEAAVQGNSESACENKGENAGEELAACKEKENAQEAENIALIVDAVGMTVGCGLLIGLGLM